MNFFANLLFTVSLVVVCGAILFVLFRRALEPFVRRNIRLSTWDEPPATYEPQPNYASVSDDEAV